MSRIFLSHSSTDDREAIALRQWLAQQNPRLANEIFLDLDPDVGIRTGERWAAALQRASARCEAVVCLLSKEWESRVECLTEYRTAETLNKRVFCARLEPDTGTKTSAWQWCDLFGDGPKTTIDIGDGQSVQFVTQGLYRLRDGIRGAGIGADSFVWPGDGPSRRPYRGWDPFDPIDAGIFFGRDAPIVNALDAVRGMRKAKTKQWFVILGPSGAGKSSFLRAGLLPRLQRDDREFLVCGIVRPERDVLLGANGFAKALFVTREAHGLTEPAVGDIEAACTHHPELIRGLLVKVQRVAQRQLLERGEEAGPPTLVLPLDQAEELLSVEGERQAESFLGLIRRLVAPSKGAPLDLIVAASIRSDRFEGLQTRPELADLGIEAFAELKPMPAAQFKEVITGPADRATQSGRPLELSPTLVTAILDDCTEGFDTLPLLSLTLSTLYDKYGSARTLTLAHYEKMGGLRRVVRNIIEGTDGTEGILDRNSEVRRTQLESLRAAFIPWLVSINPINDRPMRRVARWSDLPDASRPLIDAFVAKRLMVKDKRVGEEVAEVALESLLRQWDTLAGWLEEERENLKAADDVERAAAAWEAGGRDEAWLLAGSRLAAADAVTVQPGYRELLAPAGDFLAASRERAQEREGKRPAISMVGFICVLTGVVALSIAIANLLIPWGVLHPNTYLLYLVAFFCILVSVTGVGLLSGGGRASPGRTVWGCAVLTMAAATAAFLLWWHAFWRHYPVGWYAIALVFASLSLILIPKWRTPPYRTMALGHLAAAGAVLILVVLDGAFRPVDSFVPLSLRLVKWSSKDASECPGTLFQSLSQHETVTGNYCSAVNLDAALAVIVGITVGVVLIAAGAIRGMQAVKRQPR